MVDAVERLCNEPHQTRVVNSQSGPTDVPGGGWSKREDIVQRVRNDVGPQ